MNGKSNILLVERQEADIHKIRSILGGLYNLYVVESTTEAITRIKNDKDKFSVILSALDMPVLNGYMFAYTLKKDLNVCDIPIIISATIIDFAKTNVVEGLRIGDYDKITKPYENKLVIDLIEINIAKKSMLEHLKIQGEIDIDTNMYSFDHFKELFDLELLRASKLQTTLNCISIKTVSSEVEENLLSLIKNTCRTSDVACICEGKTEKRFLLLLPRTADQEGAMIVNRFNSVIYGLHIDRHFYDPSNVEVEDFKVDFWCTNLQTSNDIGSIIY